MWEHESREKVASQEEWSQGLHNRKLNENKNGEVSFGLHNMQVVMNFGENWQGVEVEARSSGLKNEGGVMRYKGASR